MSASQISSNTKLNSYTGTTQTIYSDMQNPTGLCDGSNINVSYNYTNRTITLTGDLSYYWRGVKKALTSPWTSAAHTATAENGIYIVPMVLVLVGVVVLGL
jgi:hypothetical protein